ncbi:MAG: hypothetical protein B6D76_09380 [gamma proteobacterium symbiont of Stewartia floridana]|nr:MAG: hypothetical protein B6D76_09380 [gamma proteobacterium symbiont of Stewartia floridana]RLW59582.1 MAG: hypothetical protein B6D75_08800 [gamma proteobacterium symbiont of Stewartia floridana]
MPAAALSAFRLIGLVAVGSIPMVLVFLVALTITVIKLLNLSVHNCCPVEVPMKINLLLISILDVIWAIGVNYMAGVLPA